MIQLILIAILGLLAQLILPWWSLAIVAFLVCLWRSQSAGQAFLSGFLGVALVWLGYALIIYMRTGGDFTGRMGELLFKVNNAALPMLATALLGGLVGGLSGLSGFLIRQASGSQTTSHAAGSTRP
jgi:hypothetical protein